MEREEILERLRRIDVLPTFPVVMAKVVDILEDPMSSAGDLAQSMDPSMASEVLRVANTAYFGTRNFRKITSIEHAIAIIGMEQVSQIILHMPFLGMMKGGDDLGRDAFIRHSMICAVASKVVSRTMHVGDEHTAYIGALMHDIGLIIVYRYFHDQYKMIEALVRDSGCTWERAESDVLSCDHGMIGGCLLTLWNIPRAITDGVMYHHFPHDALENAWNARIIDIGSRFAKSADLSDNFGNFDEFIHNNGHLVPLIEQAGLEVSVSREIDLFDGIYGLLRNLKTLLVKTEETRNDQSINC
jgi:HD-like signal output (HDOD) protein